MTESKIYTNIFGMILYFIIGGILLNISNDNNDIPYYFGCFFVFLGFFTFCVVILYMCCKKKDPQRVVLIQQHNDDLPPYSVH